MKLKVAYGADEEKRRDRLAGFGAAIVVNFGLFLATNLYPDLFRENSSRGIYLSFLPLLVNALFLVVTLIILPQFTLGYLMAVAIAEVIYVLSLALLSVTRSAAGFLAATSYGLSIVEAFSIIIFVAAVCLLLLLLERL